MKFVLVLQWPASSIKDYDEMILVENALIDGIGDIAEIDGHDAGSGEVNIFLHTNEPRLAFEAAKKTLGSRDFLIGLRAGYRERSGTVYQPIWPSELSSFSLK